MLLSLLSTITACSNQASSLSKADVRVADIDNCQSPVFVCTCVCVYTSQWMRLHVCILLKTHATRAKHPKESQKGSSLTADHLSPSARRNDGGSGDKWFPRLWSSGQHSSLSTSTCDPHLPFSSFEIMLCLFLAAPLIPFQTNQLLTLVLLRSALRVESCGCLSDLSSPGDSAGSRWVLQGLQAHGPQ